MASLLSTLCQRSLLSYALPLTSTSSGISRFFSTSSPAFVRRSKLEEDISVDELMEFLDERRGPMDSPTSGHLRLQERRIVMHYLRLVESEMPKLVGA
jgi:small subunit ribosomal protein S35